MESKNIKVIDEHGIDRVANVVCCIDVDGSDYVIYWIERDSDNDNLFISKLIKNNDGTSNMMNIEDSLEKSNLNDIVKELITHAINDENDSLSTNSVTLKNGKSINISSALFNKEQSINVQKTYITTVKKSVTKVSEEYYRVENVTNNLEFEDQKSVFFESKTSDSGIVDVNVTLDSGSEMPEILESTGSVAEPVISENIANGIESLAQTVPSEEVNTISSEVVLDAPKVQQNSVPVIPEVSVSPAPQVVTPEPISANGANVNDVPNVDARINIIGANPTTNVVSPVDLTQSSSVVVSEPVAPVNPDPVVPTSESTTSSVNTGVVSKSDKMFFDGSKETNLAEAFNEVATSQPDLTVDNVQPIREFGQEEPAVSNLNVEPVLEETKSTESAGFANNKFFIVIAITFFLAACVFLGYEVFRYFQMQ